MSYYRGDFYEGDFYRGDPGFFSFLGGLAKRAVGLIPGVGPAASLALGGGVGGTLASRAGSVLKAGRAIVIKHPVLTGAAAAGTIGALGAGGGRMMRPGVGAKMAGYHIEKRGKHVGELIKNRRMRVTNPRALRRAIRRAEGFSKLARRVMRFTHPRMARGRPVFKMRRRKK